MIDGPSDSGDDPAEDAADEDLDHLGSAEAVPRSDADHLVQLDSLGIKAEAAEDMLETEDASHESTDVGDSDETSPHLKGGPNWFKENLTGSGWGALLQMPQANPSLEAGVDFQMWARHCFMRACNCHVQVSEDLCTADIFANSRAATKAKHILTLSRDELENNIMQRETFNVPEDFEEEENPDSLEMIWVTHPSHQSFSHHTVRPSFVDLPSTSYRPTLRSWTFRHQLDPVQVRAVACVEMDESLLLCAPTSAGKTAVATYAVAMALHRHKRAIYTTPIKALSNQKFLEIGKSFGGQFVGIMTGDTVIASDAPIVVMTLEILQSMLYKQARDPNLLDDFECVVIDEAHFLGDLDRGYAWEEVLILLPPHVKLVLLSATVPNSQTIADWCARVRMKPMHVITSEQRPAPLRYFSLIWFGLYFCFPVFFWSWVQTERNTWVSSFNFGHQFFQPMWCFGETRFHSPMTSWDVVRRISLAPEDPSSVSRVHLRIVSSVGTCEKPFGREEASFIAKRCGVVHKTWSHASLADKVRI